MRLEPPHWQFDEEKLARAFTPKTRVVLFNNPLNPSATVFSRQYMELLARYCKKFDAVAICDEVWSTSCSPATCKRLFPGDTDGPVITCAGVG